jgi:hypothetical protein
MPVRIVTDSTCDLPAITIDRYGIRVVPLYINVGRQAFLDGIDITARNSPKLPEFPEHPTQPCLPYKSFTPYDCSPMKAPQTYCHPYSTAWRRRRWRTCRKKHVDQGYGIRSQQLVWNRFWSRRPLN